MVKYELVTFDYYLGDTSQGWSRISFANNIKARNYDNDVQGVVLFQLIENRKLKMEIFPKKSAGEVSGFDAGALIYER